MMRQIKFLLLTCLSVITFACSSDDSNVILTPTNPEVPTEPEEPTKVDQIVGEWRIDDMLFNDSSLGLNDCEKQSTIIFRENNIFDEKAIKYDCIPEEGNHEGTWEKGPTVGLYKIRTIEDSSNAYFNDVEWAIITIDGNKMTAVCDIDNDFLGKYKLTVLLTKK